MTTGQISESGEVTLVMTDEIFGIDIASNWAQHKLEGKRGMQYDFIGEGYWKVVIKVCSLVFSCVDSLINSIQGCFKGKDVAVLQMCETILQSGTTSDENKTLLESEFCALHVGQYFMTSMVLRAQSAKFKLPAGQSQKILS